MGDDVGAAGAGGHPGGWYPDPQHRYEQRYYDGSAWTAHVSRRGHASVDPAGSGAVALSPASVSSMAPGYVGATMRPPARPRTVWRNGAGAGLVVALIGWAITFAGALLPWFDDSTVFSVGPETADRDVLNMLRPQLVASVFYTLLIIGATTLRYQPGKVVGFLYGGCIGLVVCWHSIDRDSESTRSNLLGVFVLVVRIVTIWWLVLVVNSDERNQADPSIGAGPVVLTVGLLTMMVGVFIGRSRRLAPATSM